MTTQNNDQATGQTTPHPTTNAVAVQERTIADAVLAKVKLFEETGSIHLPKGYSAPNALKVAWLIILDTVNADKKPVLSVCTKESVANALLMMIIQGLNPVKSQCSFIAYGSTLTCQREYQGAIAIAKREAGLVSVIANAVFKGDEFAYEIDPQKLTKRITKHVQTLETMSSGEVIGAYAVKTYDDGRVEAEVMPMTQIRAAWKMGPTKGESPAHKNFPDQMAMKTVINRALKTDLNSSDDSAIMPEQIDDDMKMLDDQRTANVKQEISDNANQQELRITEDATATSETAQAVVDTTSGELVKEPVKQGRPF